MITFIGEEWSDEIAAKILPLVFEPVRNSFVQDVERGHVRLWRVEENGIFLAWLATSLDTVGGELELVLECIHGKKAVQIVEELKSRVKKLGVKSIRFETTHNEKMVKRYIAGASFKRYASIFRCEI